MRKWLSLLVAGLLATPAFSIQQVPARQISVGTGTVSALPVDAQTALESLWQTGVAHRADIDTNSADIDTNSDSISNYFANTVLATDYGSTRVDATLSNAVAAASDKWLLINGGAWNITGTVTTPTNVSLWITPGSVIGGSGTLDIYGKVFAGPYQIFGSDLDANFEGRVEAPVYAEWWGAKGDGATDDRLALQKAILAADRVDLLATTYMVGDTLLLSEDGPGDVFAGSGMNETILKVMPDTDLGGDPVIRAGNTTISRTNVFVRDFTLDFNFDNQPKDASNRVTRSSRGVYLYGAGNRIERIRFTQFGSGLTNEAFLGFTQLGSSADEEPNIISDCEAVRAGSTNYMYDTIITCFLAGDHVSGAKGNSYGVVQDCRVHNVDTLFTLNCFVGSIVERCKAWENSSAHSIAGYYRDSWPHRKIIVRDNFFDEVRHGFFVQNNSGYDFSCEYIEISDNYFGLGDWVGLGAGDDGRGIYFYLSSSDTVAGKSNWIDRLTIRDNVIYSPTTTNYGIRFQFNVTNETVTSRSAIRYIDVVDNLFLFPTNANREIQFVNSYITNSISSCFGNREKDGSLPSMHLEEESPTYSNTYYGLHMYYNAEDSL